MPNKKESIIGEGGRRIQIFSRHSIDCKHADNDAWLKCSCRKWIQFMQDGKLIKESAKTRSRAGVTAAAQAKALQLSGKVSAKVEATTIEKAVEAWLRFRFQNGESSGKADLLGQKLIDWCEKNGVTYFHQLSIERVMAFRNSLPYKTRTSSSLKVHWSVIAAFFGWAHGSKLIQENPIPSSKLFPQFKIKFKTPEVVPPTAEEIEKVLLTVGMMPWDAEQKQRVRLTMLLQRWSGMAIMDTLTLERSALGADNRIRGNRHKTNERFKIRIPMWLAEELRGFGDGKFLFWDGKRDPRSLVVKALKEYQTVFRAAKVSMTSHRFRHFRVTELLSQGWGVDDVSTMVGTSPKEIRKTYQHWITQDDQRTDRIWLEQGLDAQGNKPLIQ
jgi:integrase